MGLKVYVYNLISTATFAILLCKRCRKLNCLSSYQFGVVLLGFKALNLTEAENEERKPG
jgi:hypothetical protein